MPHLVISLCLSLIPTSEINQPTCSWEMRWHFPVMRATGRREEIQCISRVCHRQRLTFSITESKMYMCCSIRVAVFLCVWQQATRRSSILLQPYPKVYVCVHLCILAKGCVCVSGHKTRECERVYRKSMVRWKSMIYGREWCWKAVGTATPVNPDKKKKNLDRSNLMPSIFRPGSCDILACWEVCVLGSVCVQRIYRNKLNPFFNKTSLLCTTEQ